MSKNTNYPSEPVELIVFDWDGTLMDSTAAIANAICGAAEDLRLPVPTFEEAAYVIGLGLSDALKKVVPDLKPDQVQLFSDRYRHHFVQRANDLVPFEGVPEMLVDLREQPVPVTIATGKSRTGLNNALAEVGWEPYFVSTRCADEGIPKPDPWMLNDLCEELGVKPERAVMIGDTTHDLNMASSAGTHSIAVSYGAHDASDLEAHASIGLIHSGPELHGLLRALINPNAAAEGRNG